MSLKQPIIALAAVTLCAVAGLTPASAQENCGHRYQRVMEAYQMQSPRYAEVLNRYNARCLSGSSTQPGWSGDHRYRYEHERHGYGYGQDRWHRGW